MDIGMPPDDPKTSAGKIDVSEPSRVLSFLLQNAAPHRINESPFVLKQLFKIFIT
jgi:hypothetical protein